MKTKQIFIFIFINLLQVSADITYLNANELALFKKSVTARKKLATGGFGIVSEISFKGAPFIIKEAKDDSAIPTFLIKNELKMFDLLYKFYRDSSYKDLRRKSVVSYFGSFDYYGKEIIIFEKLGEGLNSANSRNYLNKLPLLDLFRFFKELAIKVRVLHDAGIFHCDIKPENMMFELNSRNFKIIDLGMAVTGSEYCKGGTDGYFPVEFFSKNSYYKSAAKFDVFSLGVTMIDFQFGKILSSSIDQACRNKRYDSYFISDKIDNIANQMKRFVDLDFGDIMVKLLNFIPFVNIANKNLLQEKFNDEIHLFYKGILHPDSTERYDIDGVLTGLTQIINLLEEFRKLKTHIII